MSVAEFLEPAAWLTPAGGPRYVQLRKRIEHGIDSGLLPPDSPLPPEREIAAITDLSRVTVRKAIETLVDEGAIVQRQGSGSFIAPETRRVEQKLSRLTSFSEDMAKRGMDTDVMFLERGVCVADTEEIGMLDLVPGDSVSRIKRLRRADARPMAIECAVLPVDILPNPIAVTSSLYALLEAYGVKPVRATQKISAVNLGPDNAKLLNVHEGAAGLSMERLSYLETGRVIEFTRSLYRGDAYDFIAELNLKDG